MESGDIILFSSITPCACCVGFLTRSKINHVGICLKHSDIFPEDKKEEKTYVLQSSFEGAANKKGIKLNLGVSLYELKDIVEFYPRIYYRPLHQRPKDPLFFSKFYQEVQQIGYDFTPSTWLGFLGIKTDKAEQEGFTCSALVAYMLNKMGIFKADWNKVEPCYFDEIDEIWIGRRREVAKWF